MASLEALAHRLARRRRARVLRRSARRVRRRSLAVIAECDALDADHGPTAFAAGWREKMEAAVAEMDDVLARL